MMTRDGFPHRRHLTRAGVVMIATLVATCGDASNAAAAGRGDRRAHAVSEERSALGSHLRSEDPIVIWLIAAGRENSPTFRRLVDTIDASDVLVYVRVDQLPPKLGGKIAFMAGAAGIRYVQIVLSARADVVQMLPIFGHELQHAVEVARDPAIVDRQSMAEEYLTHASVRIRGAALFADTAGAIGVGLQVARDLQSRHAEIRSAFERRQESRGTASQ